MGGITAGSVAGGLLGPLVAGLFGIGQQKQAPAAPAVAAPAAGKSGEQVQREAKAKSDEESRARARQRSLANGGADEVFTGGGSLATEKPAKRTLLT